MKLISANIFYKVTSFPKMLFLNLLFKFFCVCVQSSLATQLSQAMAELQQKSHIIAELSREATRTEEQANTLERLLTESQQQLLERESEARELRLAAGRREREERGERERLAGELSEEERRREMVEENVRQLQVCPSDV